MRQKRVLDVHCVYTVVTVDSVEPRESRAQKTFWPPQQKVHSTEKTLGLVTVTAIQHNHAYFWTPLVKLSHCPDITNITKTTKWCNCLGSKKHFTSRLHILWHFCHIIDSYNTEVWNNSLSCILGTPNTDALMKHIPAGQYCCNFGLAVYLSKLWFMLKLSEILTVSGGALEDCITLHFICIEQPLQTLSSICISTAKSLKPLCVVSGNSGNRNTQTAPMNK